MPPLEPYRAARPRHLRQAAAAPKTPEPFAESQAQPPSPARPRFRLRRRTTSSQLNAPTQQFLASVAAADVPVPSIEGPQVYDDEDMLSIAYPSIPQLDRIDDVTFEHPGRRRAFSPPKTPAPELAPSPSTKQFPDWSIDAALGSLESSPEYDSSRPSTARSSETSSSLCSRFSLASEDLSQCASPESDHCDRFGRFLSPDDAGRTVSRSLMTATRSAKSRKAPWTRAMSQHLWSTYAMYLQDPKVTPFQVGKSGIPPPGVCMRVAREAKRSWKGSRPVVAAKSEIKSRSSTPTAEAAGPYIEWPHTCAATRGHLRELCKARSGPSRNLQNLSNGPGPASFGRSINRFWNRRSAPARSPSVFSASDMAMSLAVCTSDSMQPEGPLARLTASQPERSTETTMLGHQPISALGDTLDQSRPPLGSPFMARSYGPSSSTGLEAAFDVSPEAQRQARTVGTLRGLRSPLRLDQSQSRSSMQKRRSRQSVLEPQRTKRPSLGSDFWINPASNENAASSAPCPLIQFSSTDSNHHDSLFVPRANLQELFEASHPAPSPAGSSGFPPITGLTPSQTVPARLGSPFSAKATSHSFPNRHFSVSTINVDAVVRPFATVHQTGGESVNNTAPSSNKTPLANRLAYIDERLKRFRRRDREGRRSQSPL